MARRRWTVPTVVALCVATATAQDICEKGGSGLFFPLFDNEHTWSTGVRAVLYLVGLLWMFLGVGIISDMFMAAIEVITAKEAVTQTKTGAMVPVKVWNATVANLTLMALGSSAPEILLNVLEVITLNFFAGDLGPSTIVGSAAFNLLVIIAVCITAVVPVGMRKISNLDVYACTAFFSIFAYVWLMCILKYISPNVVELWEALLTFAFFPILVGFAYLLDNQYLKLFPGGAGPKSQIVQIGTAHYHPYEIEAYLKELEKKHGALTAAQREEMVVSSMQAQAKPSRAQYRMMATRNLTGGKKMKVQKPGEDNAGVELAEVRVADWEKAALTALSVVNFKASAYSVLENAGKAVAVVVRSGGDLSAPLQVDYATEGVTANAGEDFVETSGVLTFGPGEAEKRIEVTIIDDDEPEEDEIFLIKLANPRPNARLGPEGMTIVTIIDDDDPGLLGFKDEETHCTAQESDGCARVYVSRFKGSSGTLTVDYECCDISATGGEEGSDQPMDYVKVSGTVTFGPEEMRHEIAVPLVDRQKYDKAETFKVVLSHVTGPNEKAALAEYVNCIVTIVHNGETRAVIDKAARILNINADKYRVGTSSWGEQFKNAFTVGDDDELGAGDEDAAPPGASDYVLHVLSLPFKVVFATCPPTDYMNGWATFVVALVYIGLVTALIADLANLFGCVVGLENEITAITLVALGTSLPDTFASKTAAQNDSDADAAIGNVTGSNSVNVFLGLGLPWSIAALYWSYFASDDAVAEWVKRYGSEDDAFTGTDDLNNDAILEEKLYKDYHGDVFVVPAGSLAFSVIIFSVCAFMGLTVLLVRRKLYGCELGGPQGPAYVSAAFLLMLWVLYVTLSSLQIKGAISAGPL